MNKNPKAFLNDATAATAIAYRLTDAVNGLDPNHGSRFGAIDISLM